MTCEKNILTSTIFLATLTGYVYCQENTCPTEPCNENMPTLTQDKTLTLTLYWDQTASRRTQPIYNNICQLITECGDQIKISWKPGANFKEVNGEIQCGNFCEADRYQGCYVQLDPNYSTSCNEPQVSDEAADSCVQNNESDCTLIKNGTDRVAKQIPDACVPAVTFNDNFDLCAHYDTYDDLKSYVCGLYDNALGCCSSGN